MTTLKLQKTTCKHPITRTEATYMCSKMFTKTCMLCGMEIIKGA